MKDIYSSFVTKLLKNGVMLSSELSDCLCKKYKLSKHYSRTVVSRLEKKKVFFTSRPLLFKNGQVGCSLIDGHYRYIKLLKENKPCLYSAYSYLKTYHGISHYNLLKLTGIINTHNTKYYDVDKVLADLKYLFSDLEITINHNVKYYTIGQKFDFEKDYNNQVVNATIAPFILYYCKKIGLIYPKPKYISKSNPFVGIETRQKLIFDASSFTSIGSYQMEKTLCVFDISINGYTEDQFNGFRYRVDTLINSTRHISGKRQRIIPIVVVGDIDYSFEQKILKYNKFILLRLTNIFGSRVKQLLKVINLAQINQISKVSEVFSIIDTSERAKDFINFMPFIFELLVNELINLYLLDNYFIKKHSEKKNLDSGEEKEFDGWFENENEILVIESKCHRNNKIKWASFNSKGKKENDCVSYFLEDKLDFLKKWQHEKGNSKEIKACFISANALDKSVYDNLSIIQTKYKHKEMPLAMTIQDLIKLIEKKQISIKNYKEWLNKYYLRKDEKIDEYKLIE